MKSEGEGMLLPCPFCGGRAEAGRTYNAETTLFKVQCMSCPAAMKGYDQSVADAIDGWNTRAAPGPDAPPLAPSREVVARALYDLNPNWSSTQFSGPEVTYWGYDTREKELAFKQADAILALSPGH
jgi:Lar family restriction alleviation protein